MYELSVKIPDIPLWVPDQAQKVINALIRQTIHLALTEVAGRVSEAAGEFADTGHLAQSLLADPATSTGGIELGGANVGGGEEVLGRVFSSLPYAIVMDQGRRAGYPVSRVGIEAIGLWAQRKLGLTADEADRAKWAIAQKIIAKGIEGKHYFQDGVTAATPRVEQLFGVMAEQLAAALVRPAGGATGTV